MQWWHRGHAGAEGALLWGACAIAATARCGLAQTTFNWIVPGAGAGTFQNSSNWSPAGGPPGILDIARFFAPGSAPVVSFAAPCATNGLVIEDADVKLQLNGHQYTVSGAAPSLSVLTAQLGALRIASGTLSSDSTIIDSTGGAGAAGAVHVLTNGTWNSSSQVIAGDAGHGIITMSPLSQASSPSTILGNLPASDADFILHGPAAVWDNSSGAFVAGASGNGLLLLDSGARLLSGSGTIAANAGSGFTVILDGPGTQWNMPTGQTIIAGAGLATMQLESGASMSTGPLASIADQAGSTGSLLLQAGLTGACTWSIAGDLHVGCGGNGSLTVKNPNGMGASVFTGGLMVGSMPAATGTITIDGVGAFIANSGVITIGAGGHGSVTIKNGAALHSGAGVVGQLKGATGQILVDGASTRWTNAMPLTIGSAGTGTVTLKSDAILIAPEVVIGATGQLVGAGGVESSVTNGGIVAPGTSAGTLLVTGSYVQQRTGMLEIELGGLQPGTHHDVIAVDGPAVLGGELHVTLIDRFQFVPGNEFVVLTADSVRGKFSKVIAPAGMSVNYGPTQVSLTVAAKCATPADLDCNGVVNGLDLALLLGAWTGAATYSPCPPSAPADLNSDCMINGFDLAALLGTWG